MKTLTDDHLTEYAGKLKTFGKVAAVFALLVCGACMPLPAQAQSPGVVNWSVSKVVGTNGLVTPTITWATVPAASSCTASGDTAWTGTKAASGTQTLPAVTTTKSYNLSCTWAGGTTTGTAILEWVAPTTNTDGTPYTNAKGFRIYRASTAAGIEGGATRDLGNPADRTTTYNDLLPGTHYFGVKVVNTDGIMSAMSPLASKTIASGGTGGTVAGQTLILAFPNTVILTVK